jgi:hypothetical protein
VFLLAAAAGFLRVWIDAARRIPAGSFLPLTELLAAAHRALPCALYIAVLLALSYSARRDIPIPLSIPCVLVLAALFTIAAALGLRQAENVGAPSAVESLPTLGRAGLILSRGNTVMVLLENPAEGRGSRVVSLDSRPLIYQENPAGPNNSVPELPPVSFGNGQAPFLVDLAADFFLSARQFELRLGRGLVPFGLYVVSLSLLLVSLRFLFGFSSWPLANIFLGALVFRGILAFESFLNGAEIQDFIGLFLGKWMPPELISPGIFCALGLLILLYTILVSLTRERRGRNG